MRPYYFTLPEYQLKTIAERGPGSSHRLVGKVELSGLTITNELLLYRVLKDLFGAPDYITCFSKQTGPTAFSIVPHPQEWGFLFSAPHSAFVEIQRKSLNSVPQLLFWAPRLRVLDNSHGDQAGSYLKGFIADLDLHLLKNKSLFSERVERESATGRAIANVYGEMLVAGDHLLEHGRQLEKEIKKRPIRFGEKTGIAPKGTFYLAACCYYLMALEGFANLLLELLLKPEYRTDTLDDRSPFFRATFRADLDLRLLSVPLYCDGFRSQGLTPQSAAYKNLLVLRKFHNSVFHNNLTEYHDILILAQDHLQFFFDPSTDRESTGSETSRSELPVRRVQITERTAVRVRDTVSEIIEEVISGMQPEYGDWCRAWANDPVIPVLRDSEGGMKVDLSLRVP